MSEKFSKFECQLIAGPFDGLTFSQSEATESIAVSLRELVPPPPNEGWAIYTRTEPIILLEDGTIEFLYEGTYAGSPD